MGGVWLKENKMTERMEHLHSRKEYNEEFVECWSAFEQQTEEAAQEHHDEAKVNKEGDGGVGSGAAKKPKHKLTENGGVASQSTPSPAKPKAKGKAKSPSEAAMLLATSMKQDYLNFQAQLKTIETATATDAEWKRAAPSLTEVRSINQELERK